MTAKKTSGYVSVIAFNYLEPISSLLKQLMSVSSRADEVQASPQENGLSCAVVILAVLMLESAIARVKIDRSQTAPPGALKFMRAEFPQYEGLDRLEELFVIRDAIAHNHLWQATIAWDTGKEMKLLDAAKWEGSGDSKLDKVLDKKTRKTKILKLNLFPTRIARDDAIAVLKETIKALLFIEDNGSKFITTSNQYIEFGKKEFITLKDLLSRL